MNKKEIGVIAFGLLIAAAILGYRYYCIYKYDHIDTVTTYIKIEYTPPTENPFYDSYSSLEKMVSNRFSEPEVRFSFVSFDNDSIAFAITRTNCENNHESFIDHLSELKPEFTPGMDESERIAQESLYKAETMAYLELLNTSTFILSFTHTRDFDTAKLLDDIKKIGFDRDKLDEYMSKNKITFKWMDVYVI